METGTVDKSSTSISNIRKIGRGEDPTLVREQARRDIRYNTVNTKKKQHQNPQAKCKDTREEAPDSFSRNILESIADGAFTVNHKFEITSFNRAAEIITGFDRNEAIGMKCYNVFRANICIDECALNKSIKTGKDIFNQQYTIKDVDGDEVKVAVCTSVLRNSKNQMIGGVETFRDISSLACLRKKIATKYNFHNIISKNHKIQKIFSTLPAISKSDSNVLIEGESGSGKELFAQAIHKLSQRPGPFVALNCAALPDALLESELFGYKKGAFTGAIKDKPGKFSLAENGTIFLDEIGDISPALQVKLLRVLQENEFEPLGATTTVKTNARVIAATNRNLKEMIENNEFRSDLFFRLNVIHISLPPFSERREDIPLLIQHFINKFRRSKKKNIQAVCPAVLNVLMQYDFPGNVRELENIIEHCFVMCRDTVIDIESLPEEVRKSVIDTVIEQDDTAEANPLSNAEASTIIAALHRYGGHRKKTADHLGVDKTTLWRKMKKYNITYPPLK
jgi:PAS domain S-box-containing protein